MPHTVVPPKLEKVSGSKWISSHACSQKVSRCCTRGQYEESIVHRSQIMHVRGKCPGFDTQCPVTIPLNFFQNKNNKTSNFVIFLRKREESDCDLRDVDLNINLNYFVTYFHIYV